MTLKTTLLLLGALSSVAAHGFLSSPPSRNYLAHQQGLEYCHHCLNGGTVGTVRSNSIDGRWPYPETPETSVRHGLCGDPAGSPQQYMEGSASIMDFNARSTFSAGSVIDVDFVITAHHRGHVEFRLCDKSTLADPSGPITQACLNQYPLEVIPGADSFVDPNYPTRFYLPPRCSGRTASNGWAYNLQVKLPAGLECEHCVLQWYYVTGNTCNAPGYSTAPWPSTFAGCGGDGGGDGWWAPHLSDCLSGSYPEEFWNCADLTLTSSGGPVVTSPPSNTNVQPTDPPSNVAAPTANPPTNTNVPPTPQPSVPTNPPSNEGTCTLNKWAACNNGGCCKGSLQCMRQHQWYSQCLDECPAAWECQTTATDPPTLSTPEPTPYPTPSVIVDPTNPPTDPPTNQPSEIVTPPPTDRPTTAPPTTQPPSVSDTCTLGEWANCHHGGCCAAGLQCMRQHQWYSQCLKSCPAGWECQGTG